MLNNSNQICEVTFVSKNISKKGSYERERSKNQELLNLVINKMPIGFMMFEAAGTLIMVNERLSDYLNLSDGTEINGKTNIHTHPFLRKMGLSEKYEEAIKGIGYHFTFYFVIRILCKTLIKRFAKGNII